jgi:inhibitor of the pro-sigma K processing machinery
VLALEWKIAFIVLAGLLGLYLIGSALVKPLKYLVRFLTWAIVGIVLLIAINAIFGRFGFHIAINPATVLTAGVLHLPGVLLLVLVNYMILS